MGEVFAVWLVGAWLLSPLFGLAIGAITDHAVLGCLLGLFFGPFGLLVAALLRHEQPAAAMPATAAASGEAAATAKPKKAVFRGLGR